MKLGPPSTVPIGKPKQQFAAFRDARAGQGNELVRLRAGCGSLGLLLIEFGPKSLDLNNQPLPFCHGNNHSSIHRLEQN